MEERDGESLSLRSGSTGGVSVAVISWRLLLAEIEVALTAAHDADALSDLRQLKGLVDRMDEDEFIPLQADELSSGVARRHIQLGELLRTLLETLGERGVCPPPRSPTASNAWGLALGSYIDLKDVRFWLGLYYGPWRDLQETPFWMQLTVEAASARDVMRALAPLRTSSPPRMIEGRGNWLIPLTCPVLVEREEIIDALVAQVCSVADLLPPAREGVRT